MYIKNSDLSLGRFFGRLTTLVGYYSGAA